MPLYKAMVVFQGFTNIAEDRFINTFHFIMASEIIADVAAAVNTDLAAFYNSTASGTSIAANMPTFVNRAATTRFYNMDTPAPRVPFIVPWTLAASSGTTPIPEEVAVVCSFHGAPPRSRPGGEAGSTSARSTRLASPLTVTVSGSRPPSSHASRPGPRPWPTPAPSG